MAKFNHILYNTFFYIRLKNGSAKNISSTFITYDENLDFTLYEQPHYYFKEKI